MTEKLFNFWLDEGVKDELSLLALRERRSLKDIITEQIKEYVKIHKEGNPQHELTSFINNEDFVGFPSIAIPMEKKKQYIEDNCVTNDKKLNDFGKELWFNVCEWHSYLGKH